MGDRMLQVVFSKYACNNISEPIFNVTSFRRRRLFLCPFEAGWFYDCFDHYSSAEKTLSQFCSVFFTCLDISASCLLECSLWQNQMPCQFCHPGTAIFFFFFMGWGIRTSYFGGTYLLCVFLIGSISSYNESDLRVFRHQFFHTTCLWIHTNHFIWCSTEETTSLTLESEKKLSLLSLLRNVGIQYRNS